MVELDKNFKEKNVLKLSSWKSLFPCMLNQDVIGYDYKLDYLERDMCEEEYDEIVDNIILDAMKCNRNNNPHYPIQNPVSMNNFLDSFLDEKKDLMYKVNTNIIYEETAKKNFLSLCDKYLHMFTLYLCEVENSKEKISYIKSILSWKDNSFPFYFPYKERNGEDIVDLDKILYKEEENIQSDKNFTLFDIDKLKIDIKEILEENLIKIKNDIIESLKEKNSSSKEYSSDIPSKEDALYHIIREKDNEIKYLKEELAKKENNKAGD